MLIVMTVTRTLVLQLIFVLIAAAAAVYVQLVMGIAPCPLCILQRLAYILVGVIVIIALLHRSQGLAQDIYFGLSLLFALFGLAIALRQVWLQLTPPETSGMCGPGLNQLVHSLPPSQLLHKIFYGAGDCGVVHWKVLGLSMAGWSAVCFLLIFIAGLWGWTRLSQQRHNAD